MQQPDCFHHFFSENVTKRKNHDTFLPIYSSKQPNSPTRLLLFVCKRKETK